MYVFLPPEKQKGVPSKPALKPLNIFSKHSTAPTKSTCEGYRRIFHPYVMVLLCFQSPPIYREATLYTICSAAGTPTAECVTKAPVVCIYGCRFSAESQAPS
ncbi:hypothetical protein MRX96_050674 [Rhipicephalus microplus]